MNFHFADGHTGSKHQNFAEIAEQPFQQALRNLCCTAAQYRMLIAASVTHIDTNAVFQGHYLSHCQISFLPEPRTLWHSTEIESLN